MNNPAIEAYRNTSFETAPPLKILRMLYAGVLRFLEQARELDPKADGPTFRERIGRADAIVSELRCALEPSHAPELATQLDQLYDFVESQLSLAALEQTAEPLEGAHAVLSMLKRAWDELEVHDLRAGLAAPEA
jgi:flagellar protein FliS